LVGDYLSSGDEGHMNSECSLKVDLQRGGNIGEGNLHAFPTRGSQRQHGSFHHAHMLHYDNDSELDMDYSKLDFNEEEEEEGQDYNGDTSSINFIYRNTTWNQDFIT